VTIDIAHLRSLLAACETPAGTWHHDTLEGAIAYRDTNDDHRWVLIAQPLNDGSAAISGDDAAFALICAAVNALPALLAIAEAAEKWAHRQRKYSALLAAVDAEQQQAANTEELQRMLSCVDGPRYELMRAVYEAAMLWRHGMVEVSPGRFVDSDDGSVDMQQAPARNALIAAVDAARKERT
jgi:hypothetical protein